MSSGEDKIYPLTRIVSGIVVPFLWLAFIILFFFPDQTGARFAWAIKPHMTAVYMGAGYLGGSWLFLNALFGRRWHRVANGFLPITAFTWAMLFATLLHWDRFSHSQLGFALWLILYIVTPFLVPALWFINRRTDPVQVEPGDMQVPRPMRWATGLVGAGASLFAMASFIYPNLIQSVWPWALSPLTGRVMSGWIALLGVGGICMTRDPRWSSWRVPLECIIVWHVVMLLGAIANANDFTGNIINWYTSAILLMLAALASLYVFMETRRRKNGI